MVRARQEKGFVTSASGVDELEQQYKWALLPLATTSFPISSADFMPSSEEGGEAQIFGLARVAKSEREHLDLRRLC